LGRLRNAEIERNLMLKFIDGNDSIEEFCAQLPESIRFHQKEKVLGGTTEDPQWVREKEKVSDEIRDQLADIEPLDKDDAEEQQAAAAEALAKQQAEAAAKQQAEALAKQQAEAAAKQQAEAAAKQQAEETQAQLLAHQKGEIVRLITQGQRLIGYLQQTLQNMPSASDIELVKTEATKGRPMRKIDGKRFKASAIGENRAESDLRMLNLQLSQAIEQAQDFLDDIATPRITTNPFFGRLSNTINPISQQTILITIRDLLSQLQRIKESLGVPKRGGSRKRRHRRRKTRRKKKKRKKKTIKRRRKKGRKTRRK